MKNGIAAMPCPSCYVQALSPEPSAYAHAAELRAVLSGEMEQEVEKYHKTGNGS